VDALLNWLWQGSLVVLAMAAFVKGTSRFLAARSRYLLWWLAFAGVLAVPILPEWPTWQTTRPPPAIAESAAILSLPAEVDASTPWLVTVWVAGGLLGIVRLALSVGAAGRARRACKPFPEDREARLRYWTVIRKRGIRTRLSVSDQVMTAAVLGIRAPVIALSPDVLARLSDDDLDSIVVHEWAHVQRFDAAANVVHRALHALFWMHPAIWWIGRQLRLERETACDDRVVSITGSCLLKLAELSNESDPALPAPAALTRSQLPARILRLLDPRRNSQQRGAGAATLLGAIFAAAATALIGGFDVINFAKPVLAAAAPADVPGVLAGRSLSLQAPVVATAKPRARPGARLRAGWPASLRETPVASTGAGEMQPSEAAFHGLETLEGAPLGVLGEPHVSTVPLESRENAIPPLAGPRLPVAAAGRNGRNQAQTPWSAAADAGIAIGRGSHRTAVATAGFFKKMSRSIAGSF
jgi:beta-lactamase regulating signal transducer with metallopeptidase domain